MLWLLESTHKSAEDAGGEEKCCRFFRSVEKVGKPNLGSGGGGGGEVHLIGGGKKLSYGHGERDKGRQRGRGRTAKISISLLVPIAREIERRSFFLAAVD